MEQKRDCLFSCEENAAAVAVIGSVSYRTASRKQRTTEGLLKNSGKIRPIIGMEDPYY